MPEKGVVQTEIFKLFGSIWVDTDKANKAIDDTDKKGKGLGDRLGSMIGTAAKVGAGIAAGASIALGGMLALANKTAAAADVIDKLSERTGINREELQRWQYAAGQSGADVKKLEVGIKKLSDVMDGAVKGNKANVAAFEQLGISLTDTSGKVRSTEAVFTDVMAALGDMEQGAARNALGNDLLGKSYVEMLPLLNAGSEGMDALKNRANELGLVMSEDAVKANVKFGDTMDDLKQSFGAVFMHISNAVLPVLQLFIDSILKNMPQIKAMFSAVFSVISYLMSGFIDGVRVVIGWLKQWGNDNQEIANAVQGYFKALFGFLEAAFKAFIAIATAIWSVYGDSIMSVAKFVWDVVGTVFKTSLKLMTDLFNIFSALFRGDWEALWTGVKNFFTHAWEGMYGVLKSIINLMIRAINGMVERLNKLEFEIPDWVPILGGMKWGFDLPTIPELYKGGRVWDDGAFLVGERGPEILSGMKGATVTPLSKAGNTTTIYMTVYGNWEEIRRELDALGVVIA